MGKGVLFDVAGEPARRGFRVWLAVALATGLLLVLIVGAVTQGGWLLDFDRAAQAWVAAHTSAPWQRAMGWLSDLHRPRGIALATAVAALGLLAWRRRAGAGAALVLAGAVLSGSIANHYLKHALMRPRPGDAIGVVSDYSLPSGHVVSALVLYGGLWALLAYEGASAALRRAAAVVATTLVLLVSASRLVLGAHHASDVIAGLAFGGAWLALCLAAYLCWRSATGMNARH